MYRYAKKTTGLTGLLVHPNPKYVLLNTYSKILRTLQKAPSDAAYRKYTEEIIKHRKDIVEAANTVEEFEEKINCGQAEELIIQAENELSLAKKFLVYKPWEPLISEPPPNQWTWPPVK